MSVDIIGSVPLKERKFDLKDADSFWEEAQKKQDDWWYLIYGQDMLALSDCWDVYCKRRPGGQETLRIMDLSTPNYRLLAVQVQSLIYKLNEETKERTSKLTNFRTDRKFPDWREVKETIIIRCKNRTAIYNSVSHMRRRFKDAAHLQFHVSDPIGKPDAEGYSHYTCTPKHLLYAATNSKKPISYSTAYKQKMRLIQKGKPVPPELLFATGPCAYGDRENLRPYFNLLMKWCGEGKFMTGEITSLHRDPIEFAQELRGFFSRESGLKVIRDTWHVDPYKCGIPINIPKVVAPLEPKAAEKFFVPTTGLKIIEKPQPGIGTIDTTTQALPKPLQGDPDYIEGWTAEQRLKDLRASLDKAIKTPEVYNRYDSVSSVLARANTIYNRYKQEILVQGLALYYADITRDGKLALEATGLNQQKQKELQEWQTTTHPGLQEWDSIPDGLVSHLDQLQTEE